MIDNPNPHSNTYAIADYLSPLFAPDMAQSLCSLNNVDLTTKQTTLAQRLYIPNVK